MSFTVRWTPSVVLSRSLRPSFLNSLVYRGVCACVGAAESTPDAKADILVSTQLRWIPSLLRFASLLKSASRTLLDGRWDPGPYPLPLVKMSVWAPWGGRLLSTDCPLSPSCPSRSGDSLASCFLLSSPGTALITGSSNYSRPPAPVPTSRQGQRHPSPAHIGWLDLPPSGFLLPPLRPSFPSTYLRS